MQHFSFTPKLSHRCSECLDTGALFDQVYYKFCDLYGPRYCSCDAGKGAFRKWCAGADVQQSLKAKRQADIQRTLEISQIPKRWREKSLENLSGQEQLKITVNRYLDDFPKLQQEGRGIYLWSQGSGRGKTHVLTAVCQQIIERYACPCIFMNEEQLFLKLRASFHAPIPAENSVLDRCLDTACLFLDDLGATKMTGWKTEIIGSIVDYRLQNALPTFFTANYSLADYQTLIANTLACSRPERIPSRIYEMCRGFIVEMKGEDFRKKFMV